MPWHTAAMLYARRIHHCRACGQATTYRTPPDDNRERAICNACGEIHYENPLNVVGTLPVWEEDGRVLLCRRAIEPRRGFWTLPAGYMEMGETVEEGARREAWEEARARIAIEGVLAVYSIARIGQVRGKGNDFHMAQPCHATFKYANGSVWVDQIYTYFTKDRRHCRTSVKEFNPDLGEAFFSWVVNDTIFADGFITKDFNEAMEKGVVMNNEASYLETFGGAVFMRQINEYGGIQSNMNKLIELGLFTGDDRAAAYVVADMVTIQKDKVLLNGGTYNGHRCWGSTNSSIKQVMAALKPTKKARDLLPDLPRFKAGWDGIEASVQRLAGAPEMAYTYLDKYPAWITTKQGWNEVKAIPVKDDAELKKVLQDLIAYINKGA